jgi:hypothetical protein
MAAVGIVGVFVDEPPWLGMLADAKWRGRKASSSQCREQLAYKSPGIGATQNAALRRRFRGAMGSAALFRTW